MYLNRRIAKPLKAVVNGKIAEEIFFGTVIKTLHKSKQQDSIRWRVSYDDDDFDDIFNEKDILDGLELYSLHRQKDPFPHQQEQPQTPRAESETDNNNARVLSRTFESPQTLDSPQIRKRTKSWTQSRESIVVVEKIEKEHGTQTNVKPYLCKNTVRNTRKGFQSLVLLLSILVLVGVIRYVSSVEQVQSEITKLSDSARQKLYGMAP